MHELNDTEVGKRLEAIRLKTSLKSRAFALKAQIDPSQYAKIEKGSLPITEKILNKLIYTYDLNRDEILYGKNVPQKETEQPVKEKPILEILMAQMNNLMQTQNNLLQRQQEQVVEKIDRVDTNLIRALQGVSKLVLHVESAREVVLDSLNRIEKKPPGALKREAGKIMDQLEDLQQKHGISVGEGM